MPIDLNSSDFQSAVLSFSQAEGCGFKSRFPLQRNQALMVKNRKGIFVSNFFLVNSFDLTALRMAWGSLEKWTAERVAS